MRILLALLFLGHGVTHLIGFLVAWQLRAFPEMPLRTTILAAAIEVGVPGTRILGVAWLLVALAFAAVAAGLALRLAWWSQAAYVTMAISFVLCILGWPDSRLGVIANAVLIALLL